MNAHATTLPQTAANPLAVQAHARWIGTLDPASRPVITLVQAASVRAPAPAARSLAADAGQAPAGYDGLAHYAAPALPSLFHIC
jgi:hypothetical protein